MPPQYKFVELSPVTDETIETCVNEWVQRGWHLEGIRFVTTEHSKRPAMAFVSFIRGEAPSAREPSTTRDDSRHAREAAGPTVITAKQGSDVD